MRHPYFLAALLIVTGPVIAADGDQRRGELLPDAYCAYDIGRLPGLPAGEISLDVTAINNRDQIVGWTGAAGGELHSFIWDRKHGMRELGSVAGHTSVIAADVNERGMVVGDATDFESGESLAFVWSRHTGVLVPDTSLGGVNSFATGINRRGQIVGASQTETGAFHAFLRDVNGDILDLGALSDGSGNSSATAVNDRGQVVGTRSAGEITEGFLWDERTGMRPLIEDPQPDVFLFPQDINNRAVVVGDILGVDPGRAFRWTRGEGTQDLGTLSGLDTHFATARSINRWGMIVGGSQTISGLVHGFVWTTQTGMRDLNELADPSSQIPSGAVLGAALGINDAGSIALIGFVPGEDSQRGFLLVPKGHSEMACR
jgi:probable HAF family extracellular repeat protein